MIWPDDLVPKRRSPEFNESTAPVALQRSHSTKTGTWAALHILAGKMIFRDLEVGTETILAEGLHRVIYPKGEHEIEIIGPVRFYVEFYERG